MYEIDHLCDTLNDLLEKKRVRNLEYHFPSLFSTSPCNCNNAAQCLCDLSDNGRLVEEAPPSSQEFMTLVTLVHIFLIIYSLLVLQFFTMHLLK